MTSFRKTVAGVDFSFEPLHEKGKFTWLLACENYSFFLEPNEEVWTLKGNIPVWIKKMKSQFIKAIKERAKGKAF